MRDMKEFEIRQRMRFDWVLYLISLTIISFKMTSPKKTVDIEKESTIFGELEKVEVI